MTKVINGIQQIGIGVADAKEVFNWYKNILGFNILLFEDEATANLMLRYTSGEAVDRYAILSLNMGGGGGLEIWQSISRQPRAPLKEIIFGDLGINAMKIRTLSLSETYQRLSEVNNIKIGPKKVLSNGEKFFYFKDPWGNMVQIAKEGYYYTKTSVQNGGVLGAVIGVSSLETSIKFYEKVLGYTLDKSSVMEFPIGPTANAQDKGPVKRAVLYSGKAQKGGFCDLFGPSILELVQVLDKKPTPIFKGRQWGDLGYIHLCFDIHGMDTLRDHCEQAGVSFKVDSRNSFDMGTAAGRFGYIEDPDGTLIEFVETHKVPLLKSLGIFLNLKKRDPHKPLPRWIVKGLGVHKRKKDLL